MTFLTRSRPVSSSESTERYCRDCGYSLHRLGTAKCPECGRPFDPDDPTTFASRSRRRQLRRIENRLVLAGLAMALLVLGIFHLDLLWLLFILTGLAAVLSSPIIILARKRARWRMWEVAGLICPILLWIALALVVPSGKSLSNMIELLLIVSLIPIAALLRALVPNPRDTATWALIIIAATCAASVLIFVVTPPLPE